MIKRISYRLLRAILGFLISPNISGHATTVPTAIVYALEQRSLFDLIVLDIVAEQLELPSPLQAFAELEEQRRFFFLFRATGLRGRVTMYRFSERMQRMQQELIDERTNSAWLIPVSVFWGRTNDKEGSFTRRIVSDHWRASSGFRRFLAVIFARSDVLVHFSPAIDWCAASTQSTSLAKNLRHVALRLREQFKHSRQSALGPVLVARHIVIDKLTKRPGFDKAKVSLRRKYAKKMVANLTYPAMRILKMVLGRFWQKAFDGIELINADATYQIAKTHTLVYVPNHRSHVDYLVLSYLLFLNGIAIPHIAAGENLNLPVVGGLLRRCGAFFMRRSFRDDPEYRKLLMDYLSYLVGEGHSIEFFIEGTRSRSGWTLPPQYGLLHMLLEIQANRETRPIALIPTYISYERLFESERYRDELSGQEKRKESLRDLLSALSISKYASGRIQVVFGKPLTLDQHVAEHGSDIVSTQALAHQVVGAIADHAVLTRTNLVACALFSFGHTGSYPLDQVAQRLEFFRSILRVESLRHSYRIDAEPSSEAVSVVSDLGFFDINQSNVELSNRTLASLAWFQNNVLHAFATPSVVAVVLLNQPGSVTPTELIRQVAGLLPHLAAVLNFSLDLRSVKRWLVHFKNAQLVIEDTDGKFAVAMTEDIENGNLRGLARLSMPALECMYVLITQIIKVQPKESTKETVVDRAIECIRATSEQRQHTTDINQNPMLEFDRRFYHAFLEQLIRTELVLIDESDRLVPSSRLAVIQRRSTIAIDKTLRATLSEIG